MKKLIDDQCSTTQQPTKFSHGDIWLVSYIPETM